MNKGKFAKKKKKKIENKNKDKCIRKIIVKIIKIFVEKQIANIIQKSFLMNYFYLILT